MAVLREDIIQIGFEIEQNPFSDMLKEIEDLKAALSSLGERFDQLRRSLRDAGNDSVDTGDNFDDLNRILRNINSGNLDELRDNIRGSNSEASKGTGIFNKLAKSLANAAKQAGTKIWSGIKTGIKGIATSIGIVSTDLIIIKQQIFSRLA